VEKRFKYPQYLLSNKQLIFSIAG